MHVLTYSEARASFKQTMDEVCRDHEPVVITRQSGEHVVMISLDDYRGIEETMYLLSAPKNAQRLMESIASHKAGRALRRDIPFNDEEAAEQGESEGSSG